jgi:uncharacterized protein YfaT (DUF1175 family)
MTAITAIALFLAVAAVFVTERVGAAYRASLLKRIHRRETRKVYSERYLEGYRRALLNPNLDFTPNQPSANQNHNQSKTKTTTVK